MALRRLRLCIALRLISSRLPCTLQGWQQLSYTYYSSDIALMFERYSTMWTRPALLC